MICLQIHARAGEANKREILLMQAAKLSALIKLSSSLCRQQARAFVNKTRTETVSNLFNKQPEFTALQGAINDFTNLMLRINL